ncbi:restriction endonuclease [Streptomyces platensis]|uniref:restriction endonuclease n=1 Tax=Streptomyces platensis TaxID=58346 RepID=UPI001F2B39D4|nr:restriction endonuclease [Streptomyces platensis]MCF3145781.1 restriction endonuclease [Streptomyces platensis]
MQEELSSPTKRIPWKSISGAVLEELLFELLDALGAKEVTWRSGGEGITNSDGKRDIEATFFLPSPEGDVRRERWWVECKGRSRTVEKDAVMSAATNAFAFSNQVDVLVIASNSHFSNPTVDWVNEWNASKRPLVKLWGRDRLGKLIEQHPVAAARAVPQSVEEAERARLLNLYFWESGICPTNRDLSFLWKYFSEHQEAMDASTITMLAYSEMVHGDIGARPWATYISNKLAPEVILQALTSLPIATVDSTKAVLASSYLLEASICNIPPGLAALIIENPFAVMTGDWGSLEEDGSPWFEAITSPIITHMLKEIGDACVHDCNRMFADLRALPEEPAGPYFWKRFGIGNPDGKRDDSVLIAEAYNAPCAVGLPLNEDRHCPLFSGSEEFSKRLIEDVVHIIMARVENPTGLLSGLIDKDQVDSVLNGLTPQVEKASKADLREMSFEMRENHFRDSFTALVNTDLARKILRQRKLEIRKSLRYHAIAVSEEAK